MCASVESTLADVDVVSGIIAVVEDQAAFSNCHQLTSCSLDHHDGMCQLLKNGNNASGVVIQGGKGGGGDS